MRDTERLAAADGQPTEDKMWLPEKRCTRPERERGNWFVGHYTTIFDLQISTLRAASQKNEERASPFKGHWTGTHTISGLLQHIVVIATGKI